MKENIIEWIDKYKNLYLKKRGIYPSYIIIPPEIEKELYTVAGEYSTVFQGNIKNVLGMEIITLPIHPKVVVLMELSGHTEKLIRSLDEM